MPNDLHPCFPGSILRLLKGFTIEIKPGHPKAMLRQRNRVATDTATEVQDAGPFIEAQLLGDKCHFLLCAILRNKRQLLRVTPLNKERLEPVLRSHQSSPFAFTANSRCASSIPRSSVSPRSSNDTSADVRARPRTVSDTSTSPGAEAPAIRAAMLTAPP